MTAPLPPDAVQYLETLAAVRERCAAVLACARRGETTSFVLHEAKLASVADLVAKLINRDYKKPTDVPPHSRWRHYTMDKRDRVAHAIAQWEAQGVEKREVARRVLDLFIVSVLLDAGAGNDWKYVEKDSGKTYARSEGLAVAALDMFNAGAFSSNPNNKFQADSAGLKALTSDKLAQGFQVSSTNPLIGVDGRRHLLATLGAVMETNEHFAGKPYSRPGNIVDFLAPHVKDNAVDLAHLWRAVQSLKPIWPSRLQLAGVPMGDVWACPCLPAGSNLVPFHKLSQWLTYSLMEPLEAVLAWRVQGKEHLTGLAEYRNGGLLVDAGVLELKPAALARATMSQGTESVPLFKPDDAAVVEWRALTVALLDAVGDLVRERVGMTRDTLELAKVLEGGTWKAGREIAAEKRPITKGPPINLLSDGTVF